jgi:hypothetical protein
MNRNPRLVLHVSRYLCDLSYHIHALYNLTKDDMFAIEMWTLFQSDEELACIGVFATVRHRKHARVSMSALEVLIFELTIVDRVPSRAVLASDVTSLDHEVGDHSVHAVAQVVKFVPFFTLAILSCTQATEVLSSKWRDVVKELNDDSTSGFGADSKVHENSLVLGHVLTLLIKL